MKWRLLPLIALKFQMVSHSDVWGDFVEAIELAANDEAVKFLVINANEGLFCRWRDLVEMQKSCQCWFNPGKIAELGQWHFFAMKRLPKPAIMSVDGPCCWQLPIWSWLQISALRRKKLFHSSFVGVGLAPDAGGLYLLIRAIGVTLQATIWLRLERHWLQRRLWLWFTL